MTTNVVKKSRQKIENKPTQKPPEGLLPVPRVLNGISFVQLVGKGAFGEVWKGVWKPGTTVALKADLPTISPAFPRESHLLNYCNHPNIVRMFGTFASEDQRNWIVMELCKTDMLSFFVSCAPAIVQIIEFAKDICKGMHHLSSIGIVHRDLSLRNLLLCQEDSRMVAKIGDFGLACHVGDKSSIVCKSKFDPQITAPESVHSVVYSEKSDVWSFGIALYQMLSRRFDKCTRAQILEKINADVGVDHVPITLRTLVKRCVNVSPAKRPSFAHIYECLDIALVPEDPPQWDCSDNFLTVLSQIKSSDTEVYYTSS